MNSTIAFAAFAVAWWIIRGAIARREERTFIAEYQRDADGIIVGAQPIVLTGTRRGAVLLLHGYNDSPQSLASIPAPDAILHLATCYGRAGESASLVPPARLLQSAAQFGPPRQQPRNARRRPAKLGNQRRRGLMRGRKTIRRRRGARESEEGRVFAFDNLGKKEDIVHARQSVPLDR